MNAYTPSASFTLREFAGTIGDAGSGGVAGGRASAGGAAAHASAMTAMLVLVMERPLLGLAIGARHGRRHEHAREAVLAPRIAPAQRCLCRIERSEERRVGTE